MSKSLAVLLTLFTALIVLGTAIWAYRITHEVMDPSSTQMTLFEVQRGERPLEIVKRLDDAQVIPDPTHFYWVGKFMGYWGKLKAGEYEVSPRMTTLEIFNILSSGKSTARVVTIPEGDNLYQIADKIQVKELASKKDIIRLAKDRRFIVALGFTDPLPPSLEGYLYPESYFFNRRTSAEQILTHMVKTFRSKWTPAMEERAQELGFSQHQIVTLASVIEKETGAASERPMISSVFHNRLKKRMKLQSDPTTIYGIWEKYQGNIHKSDLLSRTPYNTYMIPALPIGPISNPGIDAIKAALYPAESEFLFFVSHNDGTHEFTKTFKDHQNAVQRFQINKNAREGKSWRDLTPEERAKNR